LRCEGIKIWKDEILEEVFKNIDAEMDIRRIVDCKNIGI
jgi:hypothetical protein